MPNFMQLTVPMLGCIALAIFGVIGAADERWEILVASKTGTNIYFDKQTFKSTRETAAAWIRFSDSDGTHMWLVGSECGTSLGATFTIYEGQATAPDGRSLGRDTNPKQVKIAPGSSEEVLRNALCSKRPQWQQWLGR
jgi:hypothetical protein